MLVIFLFGVFHPDGHNKDKRSEILKRQQQALEDFPYLASKLETVLRLPLNFCC